MEHLALFNTAALGLLASIWGHHGIDFPIKAGLFLLALMNALRLLGLQ